MPAESRYCSNCRAELPAKAEACPVCGVFAGDIYDERMHRPRTRFAAFAALLLIAAALAAAAVWWKDRPARPAPRKAAALKVPAGPVKTEAEAIRLVRRHLVEKGGLENRCVVLLGRGLSKGGYLVRAQNHCTDTRLGNYRVDAKTGTVTRPKQ
jgi:hypothetical protein